MFILQFSFSKEYIGLIVLSTIHCQLTLQLFTYGFKDCWQNVMNSVSHTEKAALYILVVVAQKLVELIEEHDFLLDYRYPSEIQFEQQQESQDAFASNHDVRRVQKFKQSLHKEDFFKQDLTYLWIVNVVKC